MKKVLNKIKIIAEIMFTIAMLFAAWEIGYDRIRSRIVRKIRKEEIDRKYKYYGGYQYRPPYSSWSSTYDKAREACRNYADNVKECCSDCGECEPEDED